MRRSTEHRVHVSRAVVWHCLAAMLALAACATSPVPTAIPPFRASVALVDQQTAAAFADVNAFLRRQQVEFAIRQDTLAEQTFDQGLSRSDLAAWHRCFVVLDAYALHLETLLSPAQRAGVEDALAGLGRTLQQTSGESYPAGVAAAIQRLAGALAQAKAERDAMAAVRAADPGVQDVLAAMADAIGADPDHGVRGTVSTAWRQVLDTVRVHDYLQARTPAARREVALRYVAVMDQRDAQDRQLAAVRSSLLALGSAHRDLAAGRNASATLMLQQATAELVGYRAAVEAARKPLDHERPVPAEGER